MSGTPQTGPLTSNHLAALPRDAQVARFAAMAQAYGGVVEAWPEQARAWARDMAARDPQCRDYLQAEQALDALLAEDGAAAAEVPYALQERILKDAAETAAVAADVSRPAPATAGGPTESPGMLGGVLGLVVGGLKNLGASVGGVAAGQGLWRGAAMMAASLVVGLFIGMQSPNDASADQLDSAEIIALAFSHPDLTYTEETDETAPNDEKPEEGDRP